MRQEPQSNKSPRTRTAPDGKVCEIWVIIWKKKLNIRSNSSGKMKISEYKMLRQKDSDNELSDPVAASKTNW